MPDGGYALSGLQGPLTGSNLAGPRKRSAAGQDIRHGTCNFAGWRLSPGPAYRVLSQAHTSQARASAAPPGKISGTVPVISPGGGYALPGLQGPLTGSYPVGPRKRSAAGQDIRHGSCNFAGWRLSPCPAYRGLSQAHTSQARASAAPPGMRRFTSRLPDGYRTPPSPPPAPLR